MSKLATIADLTALSKELAGQQDGGKTTITMCGGTGCQASGCLAVVEAVKAELDKLGFRGERRKYTPHLTLGRVRRSAANDIAQLGTLVEEHAAFDAGTLRVDRVVVFASRLSRSGPSYDELGHVTLASD